MSNTKKKIFLVSNTAWYLYNFRLGVINFLLAKNFEVYCLAPEDKYTTSLKALGITFIHTELHAKSKNPFGDIRYCCQLLRLYRTHRPDFIFHYTIKPNIYGSIAAGIAGIPSISIVSGAGIVFLKKNFLFFVVRSLYRVAGKQAVELWFVNEEDRDLFVNEGVISKERTKVLPGEGIDVTRFSRRTSYVSLDQQNFTFLFSARLLWVKGIEYYINAARRLKTKYPNVRFLVIGFIDTSSQVAVPRDTLATWEADNTIEYLGELQDVRPLLETVHCLVFPSYYREGVPRVLLEAASMEIPIITTDNVGCRSVVIDSRNGFLCMPQNNEEVFQAMEKVLELDNKTRHEMGRQGRRIIMEKFEEGYVLEFYREATKKYLE